MKSTATFSIASAMSEATILIVDDEPTNVRLIRKVLQQSGFRNILHTTNPLDVADIIARHEIDLAIFDLMMPELTGTDLISILQKTLGDLCPPIIILTATTSIEARVDALNCGARDYVSKPFSIPELNVRVKNMLEMQISQKWIRSQNQILERRVADRTDELYKTRLEIIQRLGRAAEYRDNETGTHILRMSKTSELLARQIGLREEVCEAYLNAAPMHDIGKIGIPDSVLLKPGKLSAPEWKIMQSHAQIGADLLVGSDSPLLILAAEIALAHHEKWDGSGYPRGLSGLAIPLSARIVAMADVYDALRSRRSYKEPWSEADALVEIRRGDASHFDPDLIVAFEAIQPEVEAFRSQHADPV